LVVVESNVDRSEREAPGNVSINTVVVPLTPVVDSPLYVVDDGSSVVDESTEPVVDSFPLGDGVEPSDDDDVVVTSVLIDVVVVP
jgi:hypothetical protein